MAIINLAAESAPGARDRIVDFNRAEGDRIILKAIDAIRPRAPTTTSCSSA